jgi:hypothetical protein
VHGIKPTPKKQKGGTAKAAPVAGPVIPAAGTTARLAIVRSRKKKKNKGKKTPPRAPRQASLNNTDIGPMHHQSIRNYVTTLEAMTSACGPTCTAYAGVRPSVVVSATQMTCQ